MKKKKKKKLSWRDGSGRERDGADRARPRQKRDQVFPLPQHHEPWQMVWCWSQAVVDFNLLFLRGGGCGEEVGAGGRWRWRMLGVVGDFHASDRSSTDRS